MRIAGFTRMLMLIMVVANIITFNAMKDAAAIDGGPTGWWTDENGNNYYGDSSSNSSSASDSSSDYYSPYYESTAYDGISTAMSSLISGVMSSSRQPTYQGPSQEELRWQRNQQLSVEANGRGVAFHDQKDYDKAIECYEEALRYNPHDSNVIDSLNMARASKANLAGNKYYEEENWEMTVKCYKEAMGYRPNEVIRDNLQKAEENFNRENAERIQKAKLAEAKKNISTMLDNLAEGLDDTDAAGTSSKGSSTAGSPGLDFMAPAQREKGLRFKEIPAPGSVRQEDLPLFAKNRPDIVLDALKYGNGNWDKSVRHLEDYLFDKGKGTEMPNVQEALSYIEGIRDAGRTAEKAGKGLPDFNKKDNSALEDSMAEAIADSGTHRQKSKAVWPGIKNPDPESALPNPLNWKEERNQIAAEAFIQGNYNLENSIRYLEKKAKTETRSGGDYGVRTRQAIQYLEGISAYKIYSEERKK